MTLEAVKEASPGKEPEIAILVPCYNEALTIKKVVTDFRTELPNAKVYVYDNASSDDTAKIAREAGAIVRSEKHRGKGFVVASMFRDIDADAYIMVDGDDTYPANKVKELLAPVLENRADIVVGTRLVTYEKGAYRPMHVLGNRLVVWGINFIFRTKLTDAMSGYRAFNRDAAKRVPVVSRGFELETEMTLQALYRNMIFVEMPIPYGKRPEGSFSKLSTYRDGAKVILKIIDMFKAYRPMFFFSMIAILLGLVGLGLGSIPIYEFWQTGRVERFPTAILAAAVMIISVASFTCGVILDSINHHFRELEHQVMAAKDRASS